MQSIINSAFNEAVDIFLGSLVVFWAYRFPTQLIKDMDDRYSISSIKFISIAYLLSFTISVVLATIVYILRVYGQSADRADKVYAMTGFFMLFIPAALAIFKATYLDPKNNIPKK